MSLITQACIKEQMSVPDGIPTSSLPKCRGVGEGGLGSFHIVQSPGEYVGLSHISKIVFFVPIKLHSCWSRD